MQIILGPQYNVGEKPTVILYIYINRHAGTPKKHSTSLLFGGNALSFGANFFYFCYCCCALARQINASENALYLFFSFLVSQGFYFLSITCMIVTETIVSKCSFYYLPKPLSRVVSMVLLSIVGLYL